MSALFCLLRHGQTLWNRDKRIQGQSESPLSEKGRAQADAWGAQLAAWNLSRVVASPLGRAQQTAERCNAALGLPLQLDSRLMEQDWGAWVGRRIVDIRQEERELLRHQEARGWDFTPPGGESRTQLLRRAMDCLQDLARTCPGERLLLVSHNGVLRALALHLLGSDYLPGTPDPVARGRLLCIRAHGHGLELLDPARDLEAPF